MRVVHNACKKMKESSAYISVEMGGAFSLRNDVQHHMF